MSNRFRIQTSLLLLLFIFGKVAHSQNLPYKHLTTIDGLPSQTVYETMQDHKGFMWFATSAGISRYDGKQFVNYTVSDGLPDNDIFGFYEDVFGRIWLRSMNGKIAYVHHNKIFTSENTPALKNLDRPSQIVKITGTSDSAVLVTYFLHGVVKYNRNGTTINLYNEEDKPAGAFTGAYENSNKSYTVTRSGVILLLDSNAHLVEKDTFAFTSFANITLQGTLWVAAEDGFSAGNESCRFNSWAHTGSLIKNIAKGSANTLWICTEDGAIHFDPKEPSKRKVFLKGNQISHVFEDREQNIWFTTLNNGIMLVTNRNVKTYTTYDGLSSDKINTIVKCGDDILLGHDNFVLTKVNRQGQVSRIKFLEYLPSYIRYSKPIIYDINITPDDTLIATQFALFYLKDRRVTIISNLHGRAIVKYNDDEFLVAGRYHGLNSFSKRRAAQRSVSLKSPALIIYREAYPEFDVKQWYNGAVNSIYKQNDSVFWVGLDNGLVRITPDSIAEVHKTFPVLRERIVDVTGDDKGSVFVATSNKGVFILTPDGKLKFITEREGLNSNLCSKIAVDGNLLWVGTNAGVNRISFNADYTQLQNYIIDASAGLPSNDVNALLVDDEKVWIGTSNGLTVISRELDGTGSNAPLLYIMDISINGNPVDLLEQREFEYRENNLKISFVGLSYKTGDVRYQYCLTRGHQLADTASVTWHATQNTSVDFPSLAPGIYTFAVRARSGANGAWSKAVVYKLVIKTPFWQTSAFVVAVTIATTLLLIWLWTRILHYRKGRKEEKRRFQLAELTSLHSQMNYHFMSNAFNSLQGLFFTGMNVDQYIGKFSKLMRFTLEHSDRQLIPLGEELEYLKLYCDIEQLRVGPRFTFLIECHDQVNISRLLVPSLTLQPFIENAIWHGIMPQGDPGVVSLKICPYDSFFKIVIEDNGIGINASLLNKRANSRRSYGTKLIMSRIEAIKRQTKTNVGIEIEDRCSHDHASGTRVSLAFPYTYYE
jgi:ligand-binding sensor domain-containing protein